MKNKGMCILLSVFFILTNSISMVFAMTPDANHSLTEKEVELISSINILEEIQRAEAGITDVVISEKIKNEISAHTIKNDGVKENIEVKATIRNLGNVTKNGISGTMYTLTAVARGVEKTDSGSTTRRGTTAYASVTWIDNFGTKNELVRVSGGWDPGDNTLSDRNVNYGVTTGVIRHRVPSTNSFIYLGTSAMVGRTLFVSTSVELVGYNESLELFVNSSIFS